MQNSLTANFSAKTQFKHEQRSAGPENKRKELWKAGEGWAGEDQEEGAEDGWGELQCGAEKTHYWVEWTWARG